MAPKRPRVDSQVVAEDAPQPRKRRRSDDEEELEVDPVMKDGQAEVMDVSDESDFFSEVESDADMEDPDDVDRNIQGAPGTLQTIVMKNFMCHAHLKVEFSGRINFLTGPNGSGKSAVLVAIVIGLGAKTAFTGRGKKLESVVMTGKNSCTVSVKIANKGVDAFKHSLYGDSITVERVIRVGGSGTWKVMDHRGKEVARTKSEVTQITEHFNLQVDNPCAILMQDTSRQYLSESTAQAKYKFFMVGTKLQKIEDDYFFVNDQNEIIKKMIAKKEKHLTIMKEAVEKAKEEHDRLAHLRDLETQVNVLKDTLAWTLVKEQEDKLASLVEAEDLYEEKVKKVNERAKKIEKGQASLQGEIEHAERKAAALGEEISAATRAKADLDRAAGLVKRKVHDIRNARKGHLADQEDYERRRNRILKEVTKLKNASTQSGAAAEEQRLLAERAELDKAVAAFRIEQKEIDRAADAKGRELNAAKADAADVREQVNAVRSRVTKCKRTIEQIKNQTTNKMLVFGHRTPQIHELIKENINRFSTPPVGPIGMYLNLKAPEWALAVEEAVGRKIMTGYVLATHNDERLFKDLLRRRNITVPLLVVTKKATQRYHLDERSLPPPHHLSVLQVLDVNDPWVFNALVDQTGFHGKLLFKDRAAAESVIYARGSRLTSAHLLDGSRVFSTNGSKNFVPCRANGPSMLNFDSARSLAGGVRELEQATEEQRQLEEQAQAASDLVRKFERELKSIGASRKALSRQESEVERKRARIENQLANREEPPDISEMEANAAELAEKIAELSTEVEKRDEEIEVAKKELEEKIAAQAAQSEVLERLEEQSDHIEGELTKLGEKSAKLALILQNSNAKLNKVNEDLRKLRESKAALEEEIEVSITNIEKSNVCPREAVGDLNRSAEKLDKLISKLEAKLKASRAVEGNKTVDEALREALRLKQRHKDTVKALVDMKHFTERTDDLLRQRAADWRKNRKMTANSIHMLFMSFLSRKGHTGSADFDHKAQTLNLSVQLEKLSTKAVHQSTNSLSGGERSYTTVSLLMAIWNSMMTPFTAMDEFDVFMDQVTRKKSVDTLLEFARHYDQQQFIFITPQSLTGEMGPDVKVTRMYPPER